MAHGAWTYWAKMNQHQYVLHGLHCFPRAGLLQVRAEEGRQLLALTVGGTLTSLVKHVWAKGLSKHIIIIKRGRPR